MFGQAKQNTASTTSIPSPIGGWNARDSLAQMAPTDAVELVNWYPTPTDVTLRKGYTQTSLLTTNTGAQTITSITHADSIATLITASAHNLQTGDQIAVTGASPAQYNGVFTVTRVNATTFTYIMLSPPATNATVVGVYEIGIDTPVNTLMNYTETSTYKLFGAAGDSIYETKANPAVKVFTGISSDKLQFVNITNTGGHYLVACNGIDPTMVYDGTSWFYLATTSTAQTISTITRVSTLATLTTAAPHGLVTNNKVTITGATSSEYNGSFVITVTGANTFTYTMASAPAANATVVGTYTVLGVTGVNSNKFVNVNLFKNRLYFTEEDSLSCWYLDTNAVAGIAEPLYFGGIARNGGYLQAMGTWTLDAGQGADDYAVFVTSMGEVIVYNGTDPNDAATWALKGVWQLGYVFARRCFYKFSGDILLLTQDGLVPLASALQSSRLDPRVNLTDKIYYAISQAATLYGINFGWQIAYYASENMLIINVPINSGTQQFVMNTISKAWASFTDISAQCWELSNDQMYFGSAGYVGHFWNAYSDNGNNINASVQQAYSYFDARGQLKRFTMIRPIFQTDNGTPSVLTGINVDFDTQNNLGTVSFNAQNAAIGSWDNAIWDESQWGGALSITKSWQGVTGLGYSGGVVMKIASQGIDVHWASTDYVMERGGVL
jgi:hypothetical protein